MTKILEDGDIYFLYRPRVGEEQSSHWMTLQPLGIGRPQAREAERP